MNAICDVVVLTWNQKDIIETFVESFLDKTEVPSRLIIVDNNSQDGTVEHLKSLKDSGEDIKIELILNDENVGYVGGMNQGIKISEAPYVCLCNNDLIFTKGWLKRIIEVFEKYPKIGIINPDSNNFDAVPPSDMSLDEYAKILSKKEHLFEEMISAVGFCMVIKRDVIQKLGGMSEEFMPIFFEDTDYSMRAKKEGYLVGVAKNSYVWHDEHASFKKMGKNKEKIFVKNRETFFKKWGKILRIAWVIEDYNQLQENLNFALELVREGNFLWFYVKNIEINPDKFFSRLKVFSHSGIHFIKFNSNLELLWKILKKKKKFSLIIVGRPLIKIFKFLKFIHKSEVLKNENKDVIKKVYNKRKFEGQNESSSNL